MWVYGFHRIYNFLNFSIKASQRFFKSCAGQHDSWWQHCLKISRRGQATGQSQKSIRQNIHEIPCRVQQPAVRTILKILNIPKYLQTHVCPAWNWWPASVSCSELDLQSVKLYSLNNIHPKIELPNCLDTEIIINAKYKSQTPHKWVYNHNQLLNVESSTAWEEQEPGLG